MPKTDGGAVEAFPIRSHLAHRIRHHDPNFFTRRDYDLYPIRAARPATGQTTAVVACGTCGEAVRLIVNSDAMCRSSRIRLYLAGLGGLAVMIGGLVTLGYATNVWVAVSIGGMLGLPMLVVAVSLFLVARSDALEGVKIESSTHTLRNPGAFRDPPPTPYNGPTEVGI